MAPPTSPDADPLFPAPLDDGFLDLIESIREPALVFLSGGRIVAVNRAMARLPGPPAGRACFPPEGPSPVFTARAAGDKMLHSRGSRLTKQTPSGIRTDRQNERADI